MSEEQAQQLMYQMQMLETYFGELAQREATLYSVLREATSAIDSIRSLKLKDDSETLVPIGMGTFVKSSISSKEKVVLNVGAGVAIEKDSDSAINYLEARLKEIQVALQETSVKKQEAAAQLEQGKAQINQLMQAASQQK